MAEGSAQLAALMLLISSGLLNYLLHSSLTLSGAWLLERGPARAWSGPARERLWRLALFGPVLSALLACAWTPPLPPTLPQPLPQSAHTRPSGATATDLFEQQQASPPTNTANTATAPVSSPAPAPAPATQFKRLSLSAEASLWAAALGSVWALWALLALAGTGLAWWQLARQARALPLLQDPAWLQCAEQLARRAGLAHPTLRWSRHWHSPMISPDGAICLPHWALHGLQPAQRETVLAHELAHLRRHDPAWRLAGQLLGAVAWPQALNRMALRRLDELAEQACDAWATQGQPGPAATQARRALAESLYLCAQQLQGSGDRQGRRLKLLSAMARRSSPLLRRIELLLQAPLNTSPNGDSPMNQPLPLPPAALSPAERWRKRLLVGAIAGAALALPLLGVGHSQPLNLDRLLHLGSSLSFQIGNRGLQIRKHHEGQNLDISLSGQASFNADQTELTRLSHGRLVIEESSRHWRRKALYEPDPSGGAPLLRYSLNGVEQALDAEGRSWLQSRLSLAGETLEGSEKRVRHLLAQGGPERVLADLDEPKDEVDAYRLRARAEALLQSGPQSDSTLSRLLEISTRMDSDFERRSLLQTLLDRQALSPALQTQLLQGLASLDSDFERRQVLETLAPQLHDHEATLKAWTEAVSGMDSDFERRSAIVSLLAPASAAQLSARLAAALQAGQGMDSDFELRSVLEAVAARLPELQQRPEALALIQGYGQASRHIESDFERRSALMALLHSGSRNPPTLLSVLSAARELDSEFERAELLLAVAQDMPADPELLAHYRQAARGLNGHERGRVEAALDPLSERLPAMPTLPALPAPPQAPKAPPAARLSTAP